MNEVTETTEEQTSALARLHDASESVIRTAGEIRFEMDEMMKDVRNGFHASSVNHQRPFDLQRVLTQREERLNVCLRLDCDRAAIIEASMGA